ncbi:MAG: hypothetical protein H8K11_10800 [Nitrospira sp.]|nr:hypothetical protein [Nitrospira sp.]
MGLRGHKTAVVSSGLAVRFLVALMGSAHMAFPSHWVRGIVTPVEGGKDGHVTWANASYERTDLARRLTIQAEGVTAETRIVLYANEERSRSFAVDKVVGLIDVERALIQPLPAQFRGGERERLLGLFVESSYIALIANPFWVLELPSRNNVLDVFALRVSERRPGEFDSRLRLPSAALEAASAMSAGSAK